MSTVGLGSRDLMQATVAVTTTLLPRYWSVNVNYVRVSESPAKLLKSERDSDIMANHANTSLLEQNKWENST